MRYTCNVPGFENCFVEVSERWTRGDVKNFFALKGEEYLTLLRAKIVAIHLDTDSTPIDDAEKLTSDAADNVDYMLWRWFSVAVQKGVDDLYAMGEASARRWLDGVAN
jgi:hypothetical protein